jgi:hypothetical protein
MQQPRISVLIYKVRTPHTGHTTEAGVVSSPEAAVNHGLAITRARRAGRNMPGLLPETRAAPRHGRTSANVRTAWGAVALWRSVGYDKADDGLLLHELGGIKTLIAHNYYGEAEFWSI